MEPISNTDRIIAILRQRLRDTARLAPSDAKGKRQAQSSAAQGLAALASLEGATTAQLRRACVQALLAEQLGGGLLNDAQFQQVVTRVTDTIEDDPTATQLLDRVLGTLKRA